jgi:uncharacterized membrane protein
MAKVETSTVINRPVEEVFAVVSNPENYPKWISSSVEVKMASGRLIGVGTTFRPVVKFLGRQIESETEITEYEPNRRYVEKSISGPFPVENSLTFERVEGGTRVSLTTVAEPGGFFKLAEPLLMSIVKHQFEADLVTLKDLMEAGAL